MSKVINMHYESNECHFAERLVAPGTDTSHTGANYYGGEARAYVSRSIKVTAILRWQLPFVDTNNPKHFIDKTSDDDEDEDNDTQSHSTFQPQNPKKIKKKQNIFSVDLIRAGKIVFGSIEQNFGRNFHWCKFHSKFKNNNSCVFVCVWNNTSTERRNDAPNDGCEKWIK